jgi:hypothetical protein
MKDSIHNNLLKFSCLSFLIITLLINTSKGKQLNNIHDFSSAQIVTAHQLSDTEYAALEMLIQEIESRTTLRLSVATNWPERVVPVIVVGTK